MRITTFWRVTVVLFLLALMTGVSQTAAQEFARPTVHAVFFHSPSCGHCHYVIQEVLPPLMEQYGDQLQIVGVNVSEPGGQEMYQAAIAHFQIPQDRRGVPTLIVGETVLVGSGEIPEQLPGLIASGLQAGGVNWPAIPGLREALEATETSAQPSPQESPIVEGPMPAETPTLAVADAAGGGGSMEVDAAEGADLVATGPAAPVYLVYFFDPSCLACLQVGKDLDELEAQYENLIVERHNISDEAALNEALSNKYGVPIDKRMLAPAIFVGDEYLAPTEITRERLFAVVSSPSASASLPPWTGITADDEAVTAGIMARFAQFSVLAVAGAGLLDGVNPCGFTTIIFFVSYLAMVGRKGRDILLVGAAFTLAVFLTYLSLGLGLAELVRQMGTFATIGRILYGITAVICLVLASVSLWDYVQIRRGRLKDIALQLPNALKKRIHGTIRTSSRMRNFVLAAFGAGILVSVFELACTGQVYLPTIVFVAGVAEARPLAIAYLLLYNIMFVVPLIVVFTITYLGTSSEQLTALFQARAGLVKLLTAVLFGVLGSWLIVMLLGTVF